MQAGAMPIDPYAVLAELMNTCKRPNATEFTAVMEGRRHLRVCLFTSVNSCGGHRHGAQPTEISRGGIHATNKRSKVRQEAPWYSAQCRSALGRRRVPRADALCLSQPWDDPQSVPATRLCRPYGVLADGGASRCGRASASRFRNGHHC